MVAPETKPPCGFNQEYSATLGDPQLAPEPPIKGKLR